MVVLDRSSTVVPMAEFYANRLNQDFFWFIVNPEQHAWVLDQKRVDYIWRAKQNPWHVLAHALPAWAGSLHMHDDKAGLVTRKASLDALRGHVKHDSHNAYDLDLQRLVELGVLQRRSRGIYHVGAAHAGAAIWFVDHELPRVLENGGEEKRLEDRVREAARRFKVKVDSLPAYSPHALARLVPPYVPNGGPQGRRTPSYTTAYLLWRFAAAQLANWDRRGAQWLEPAETKLADVKAFARQWGLRTGHQGLQEFIDLGRACGLFRDAKRGLINYFPGFAPIVNRLMWELLPGTIANVRDAIPLASTLRNGMAGAFANGGFGFHVSQGWRDHLPWKYVPAAGAQDRNLPGTFVDLRESENGEAATPVASPTHLMLGAKTCATNLRPASAAQREDQWWHQVIHRSEDILEQRPDWGAFAFAIPPNIGDPDQGGRAVRWAPDNEMTYFDLIFSAVDYGFMPEAVVFVEGLKDQRRGAESFHRMEMRVVTMHNEVRLTCDLLKENGKVVPQLWMPLPPNSRPGFEPDRFREVIVAAKSPEARAMYVEMMKAHAPELWAKIQREVARPVVRDRKGRPVPGPSPPSGERSGS